MRPAEVAEFTAFVQGRSASLFRTALLLTGRQDLADDLVQSTLEKTCKHWGRVGRADSPESYARRILVNLANDRWRGLRGRSEVPLDDADDHRAAPAVGDPIGQLVLRDQLMRVLHTLPVNMRTVLVLRYFDDLSDESIADLMNVATSTVRSQAARGLAKLRTAVAETEKHGPEGRGARDERVR
jgi:RNA polymerase sigma-70 factor (sigma-E family)